MMREPRPGRSPRRQPSLDNRQTFPVTRAVLGASALFTAAAGIMWATSRAPRSEPTPTQLPTKPIEQPFVAPTNTPRVIFTATPNIIPTRTIPSTSKEVGKPTLPSKAEVKPQTGMDIIRVEAQKIHVPEQDKESERALWRDVMNVWATPITNRNRVEVAEQRIETLIKAISNSKNPYFKDVFQLMKKYDVLYQSDDILQAADGDYNILRSRKVDNGRLLLRIHLSRFGALDPLNASPFALALGIAEQAKRIDETMQKPEVQQAITAEDKDKAMLRIEDNIAVYALIRSEGTAYAAQTLLYHLAATNEARGFHDREIDYLQETLAFIQCGRANNVCFRQSIGMASPPLQAKPTVRLF